MKITLYTIILFFNSLLVFFSFKSGISKGDMTYYFQEEEAVTFFSALMLGLTSFTGFLNANLENKLNNTPIYKNFWFISAIGFFYLCMDEFFMAHEGMDSAIAKYIFHYQNEVQLDGATLAFFGLIGLLVCIGFRKQILSYDKMMPFLILGAICFTGTVSFDLLYPATNLGDVYIVIEESFKILGVSFFFSGYLAAFFSLFQKIK